MKSPWVSRELYDRVVADLEKSELERKDLLDRLIGVSPSALPIDAEALTKKATEEPESFAPTAVSVNSPSGFARHVQHMFDKSRGNATGA